MDVLTLHCARHYIHTSLDPHDITSTRRYIHTTLRPHDITSTRHYVHTTLCPHVITSTRHYVHKILYLLAIKSSTISYFEKKCNLNKGLNAVIKFNIKINAIILQLMYLFYIFNIYKLFLFKFY